MKEPTALTGLEEVAQLEVAEGFELSPGMQKLLVDLVMKHEREMFVLMKRVTKLESTERLAP